MGKRSRIDIVMTDGEKLTFLGPEADKVYDALVSAMETNGRVIVHMDGTGVVRFDGADIRSVT